MSHLRVVLHVRPEEQGLVLLVGAVFLGTQATHVLSANTADALFFSRFGVEFLPQMYMLLGLLTMGALGVNVTNRSGGWMVFVRLSRGHDSNRRCPAAYGFPFIGLRTPRTTHLQRAKADHEARRRDHELGTHRPIDGAAGGQSRRTQKRSRFVSAEP